MNASDYFQSFYYALLITGWGLIPTIIGLIFIIFAFKNKWKFTYYSAISASTVSASLAFFHVYSYVYGEGQKDALGDGFLFLFMPFILSVVSAFCFLIIRFGHFVGDKDFTRDIVYRSPSAYWILLPVIFCLLYFGTAWSWMLRNAISVKAQRSSSEADLRWIYRNTTGKDADFSTPFDLSQNPHAPPEILSEIAHSKHPSIRVFVAKNPNTPTTIVERLVNDDNSCVRQTAIEELKRRNVTHEDKVIPCR